MRTIIISDTHGYPELISNALEHVGFRPGEDRFIFAGDFLDGGPGAERALELIEELADVILLGNHELSAMMGISIMPQDEDSFGFADRLTERMLDFDGRFGGRWQLACEEQGVFVCHSCVSAEFTPEYEDAAGSVAGLAERLNSELRVLLGRIGVGSARPDEEAAAQRLIGMDGPLWYRPLWLGQALPLPGVVQVVGHTPREFYKAGGVELLKTMGVYLVAPPVAEFDSEWLAHACRYGVIEHGAVRVVSEGV